MHEEKEQGRKLTREEKEQGWKQVSSNCVLFYFILFTLFIYMCDPYQSNGSTGIKGAC